MHYKTHSITTQYVQYNHTCFTAQLNHLLHIRQQVEENEHRVSPPTGGQVCGGGCAEYPAFFFEFSNKKCRVLCCTFIVKNYLWPETGSVGLIDPLGAEDVKHMGGGVKI